MTEAWQEWQSTALMADLQVDTETGELSEASGYFTNPEPVWVPEGTVLRWREESLEGRIAHYRPEIPDRLVHTYCYQPESNWTTWDRAQSEEAWSRDDRRFDRETWFRVTIRGLSQIGSLPKTLGEVLALELPEREVPPPDWMLREADRVASEVNGAGGCAFILLADTHYSPGCPWPDTVRALTETARRIQPKGILHLGDFTDGLQSAALTERYTRRVVDGLRSLGLPVYCALGNHDFNAFRGNKEVMDRTVLSALYLDGQAANSRVDVPEARVRILLLESYDPMRTQRYGFADETVGWLHRELRRIPKDWRVLILSHVPPLAEMHVWSSSILNGPKMLALLERFHRVRRGRGVLGWIHGHNHADQVWKSRAFPIVSIGCAKLEDFRDHKPEGSETAERQQGTRTQELWEVLVLHPEEPGFRLIRFGAGRNRKPKSLRWLEMEEEA